MSVFPNDPPPLAVTFSDNVTISFGCSFDESTGVVRMTLGNVSCTLQQIRHILLELIYGEGVTLFGSKYIYNREDLKDEHVRSLIEIAKADNHPVVVAAVTAMSVTAAMAKRGISLEPFPDHSTDELRAVMKVSVGGVYDAAQFARDTVLFLYRKAWTSEESQANTWDFLLSLAAGKAADDARTFEVIVRSLADSLGVPNDRNLIRLSQEFFGSAARVMREASAVLREGVLFDRVVGVLALRPPMAVLQSGELIDASLALTLKNIEMSEENRMHLKHLRRKHLLGRIWVVAIAARSFSRQL